MAIGPRCAIGRSGTGASFSRTLTAWTNSAGGYAGTAPAAGDIVFIFGTVAIASATITQTAGTGTFTFYSSGDNNGGAVPLTTWIAWRVFDGTETAPTFTWPSSVSYTMIAAAFAPDAGRLVSIDTWASNVIDTTAATTHTPGAAAVTPPGSGLSLLMAGDASSAFGTFTMSFAVASGYTSPGQSTASLTGTASTFGYGGAFSYKSGLTGTVTPGAWTMEGGSSAVGTTTANVYHVLLRESAAQAVLNTQQAVMTAATR